MDDEEVEGSEEAEEEVALMEVLTPMTRDESGQLMRLLTVARGSFVSPARFPLIVQTPGLTLDERDVLARARFEPQFVDELAVDE